jgi:hypothetical protein
MERKSLAYVLAVATLTLGTASCAKSLQSLSPFPCAGDGTCPDGFSCSGGECVDSNSGPTGSFGSGPVGSGPLPMPSSTNSTSNTGTSGPPSASSTIHGIGGLCLDVWMSNPESTTVDAYSCNGTNAQVFSFNDSGTLSNFWGYCLDVVNLNNSFGTLAFTPCTGSSTQQWHYSGSQIGGPDGECLDVNGGLTTPGTQVDLWTCNGTAAQVWTVQ